MSTKRRNSEGSPASPSLFSPRVSRDRGRNSVAVTLASQKDTNILSTSSFRYESPGNGLKSTQEIELDWEKFENHTFFNSAQSKAFLLAMNPCIFQNTCH